MESNTSIKTKNIYYIYKNFHLQNVSAEMGRRQAIHNVNV